MRHRPQALTGLQIDGDDLSIGRLEERKAEHRRLRVLGLAAGVVIQDARLRRPFDDHRANNVF
jgi:hypothetical protein